MVSKWQLWLSPRPEKRTPIASEPRMVQAHDAALFEFLKEDGRWVVKETHYFNNKVVRDGRSGPPLHIHWLQTEYFKVEKGVIGVMKNGKEVVATKDDGILEIPAGTRHRFWAHSSTREDLVFKVWAEPQDLDHSFDENFLRNFTGYQRDCEKAGLKPSPFQLILLSYNSATMGTPPFWLPIWLLKAVNYVLAYWVAGWLLGYKESYPEYTRATKATTQDRKSV